VGKARSRAVTYNRPRPSRAARVEQPTPPAPPRSWRVFGEQIRAASLGKVLAIADVAVAELDPAGGQSRQPRPFRLSSAITLLCGMSRFNDKARCEPAKPRRR
jgi:hypothetical protein